MESNNVDKKTFWQRIINGKKSLANIFFAKNIFRQRQFLRENSSWFFLCKYFFFTKFESFKNIFFIAKKNAIALNIPIICSVLITFQIVCPLKSVYLCLKMLPRVDSVLHNSHKIIYCFNQAFLQWPKLCVF